MRRAALIFNPRAGRWRTSRLVAEIRGLLQEQGFAIRDRPTRGPGDAAPLAREAAAGGCAVVFAFGGDGTLREAAAGLLGTGCVLGPIPGGTANVVPFSLGIPLRPLVAARELGGYPIREMDVGLCGEEIFLMQTSAGLDARTLNRLTPGGKRLFGKAAVAFSGLRQWTTYRYPVLDLVADGRPFQATFAAVCNLPHYGGSFRMAPGATCSDRRLDLVLFAGRGRAATLAFAADLARGRHIARRDVTRLRVEEVELRAPADFPLQVDGDAIPTRLPVSVRLARERLRILAP